MTQSVSARALERMAPPGAPAKPRPDAPAAAPALPTDSVQLHGSPEPDRPTLTLARLGLAAASAVAAAVSMAGPLVAPAYAGSPRPVPSQIGHGLHHDHGRDWDRQTFRGDEGSGWSVPRNTDPTPVRPGHVHEVREGTRDLGPVQVLDNTRGQIRSVRLQWPDTEDARSRKAQTEMVRDLLTKLDPSVKFEIVAEAGGVRDLQALLEEVGLARSGRVEVHPLSLRSTRTEWVQGMSMWSRDSSVTLTRAADGREVLLLPRSFRDDGQVDAYLNRRIVQASGVAPASLTRDHPDLLIRRSTLDFEGGDVVANGRHVMVSVETLKENAQRMNLDPAQVQRLFEADFGREVIPIDPEPDFHLDLGLGFLDDRTVTVASPALAEGAAPSATVSAEELQVMRDSTRAKGLQEKYDAAARALEARGYRVVRLPNLAGRDLQSPYLTYQNVLLERYTGKDGREVRKVYLPVYGLPQVDAAARAAYEAEGFQVVEIRAALHSTRLGGGVRCAVSELDVAN